MSGRAIRLRLQRLPGAALPLPEGAFLDVDLSIAPAIIGSGSRASVRIPDAAIAPEHVRLEAAANGLIVAAAAECLVDGAPLAAGGRRRVDARLELAGRIAIDIGPAPPGVEPSHADRTASLARELVRDILGAATGVPMPPLQGPELEGRAGAAIGISHRLPPPEARIIIGRGEDATIALADPDLSRAHVAIDRLWDGSRAIDLESKNGCAVDGQPVPRAGWLPLRDGSIIRVGSCELIYRDPAERYLRELDARMTRTPVPGQLMVPPSGPIAAPAADTVTRVAASPLVPAAGAPAAVSGAASGSPAASVAAAAAAGRAAPAPAPAPVSAAAIAAAAAPEPAAADAADPPRPAALVAPSPAPRSAHLPMLVAGAIVAAALAALAWLLVG